jgi:hypothetical protein
MRAAVFNGSGPPDVVRVAEVEKPDVEGTFGGSCPVLDDPGIRRANAMTPPGLRLRARWSMSLL